MFPAEFIRRIETQEYIDSLSLLKALEEPSPVSIRINSGKWERVPMNSGQVPWCKTGYYLQSRPSFTLDPLFHAGCYYPREASGMFLEEVFRQTVEKSEKLRALDLCGAPGGKSTQIGDLIGPSGLLISNEVIRSRAPVLAETMVKWGTTGSIVTQNDPSDFSRLQGYFDVIVIDAPCSGEGMFRTKIALEEWSPENALLCSDRQKRIISDIWPALKENGILIYSTCTFNSDENENNIRWLLKENQAECIRLDISAFNGIKEIDSDGVYGYGFYPGMIKGEGFFISAVKKTGKQTSLHVKGRKNNQLLPGKSDVSAVEKCVTGNHPLLRWKEELNVIPCSMDEYSFLFNNLNVIKGGTRIFVNKKSDYLPTHELALSQLLRKDAFPVCEVNLSEALAFLRRDNLLRAGMAEGWNIISYKGVSLGFAKNIGKRLNNYFPVEWRIRMELPEKGKENIIEWE